MSSLTPARNRLEAFVQSRSEWCISRQRSWGVPIPALFDEAGKPLLNSESLSHIISVLESKGTDHWWTGPVSDFAPPNGVYTKGNDTLDVWFDSGSSWTLLNRVADVYLEGSDQHRGWFQSSLLTHLTAAPTAPYKNLITHGFIMDENGQKMSKSAGNGLSPMEVVNGTEVSARTRPH
jgi:isoleucyl-tRNA synthetase